MWLRGMVTGSVVAFVIGHGATVSEAQSAGPGASPGRAAYRPASQWNNGPYLTTVHIDPYRPHATAFNGLPTIEPNAPPAGLAPHGRYATFATARGTLYPYEQGFSPLSGYAGWYQQAYGIRPTNDDTLRARGEFFRSAPLAPYSRVLTPLPPTARLAPVAIPALPAANGFKIVTPPAPAAASPGDVRPTPRRARVYRSSLAS